MRSSQTELIRNGLLQACTGEVERKSTRASVKSSERLSDRDWAELMGVNRQTHKRVNGAVRRR